MHYRNHTVWYTAHTPADEKRAPVSIFPEVTTSSPCPDTKTARGCRNSTHVNLVGQTDVMNVSLICKARLPGWTADIFMKFRSPSSIVTSRGPKCGSHYSIATSGRACLATKHVPRASFCVTAKASGFQYAKRAATTPRITLLSCDCLLKYISEYCCHGNG